MPATRLPTRRECSVPESERGERADGERERDHDQRSGAGNYTYNSTATTTANITPAALTLTAVTNTKVYNGTTNASAIPTVSGLKGSDTVTDLMETYATATVGTGKTLNVSIYTINDGNGGNNYTVSVVANTTGVITATADGERPFLGEDTTTQGNWIGKYGSLGYDLIGSSSSLPAGCHGHSVGQSSYTWANPRRCAQALEVPPSGATRVAACWYSATSFTVDVNAGAGTYNLELYVLDYDK